MHRIKIFAGALALTICCFTVIVGQPRTGGGGVKVKDTKPKQTSHPTSSAVRTVYKTKVERVVVTPTTGALSVAAEPSSTIVVDPIKIRNGERQQADMPAGEKVFVFNSLKPGTYRVSGTLAGHRDVETQVVIAANQNKPITLNFEPIRYSVIVNTNVSSGELKYALQGQPLQYTTPIQNRTAKLQLTAGEYVAEVTTDEFGYGSLRKNFSVSKDDTILEMPLDRVALSTETLIATWGSGELQNWVVPENWRADSKKNLNVKGAGIALRKDEGYRHYKDFRLSSSVKMVNGVGVSFVLRARDSQNYYLLQLTGEKSDEPNSVRLFVVKNGKEQRVQAIPIPRDGAKSMSAGKFFTVSIKMVDFRIIVEVVDAETGAPYPLGGLTDPLHNFAVGAVGIGGHADEENVIGRFVVCTGDKCLNE